jgi:uncharacterized C2H2 Zn-finger protein
MESKSETEGFLCPVPRCDRIFMNTSVYFTHVEIHTLVGWPKDGQRCFPCDQCKKSYDNSKGNLNFKGVWDSDLIKALEALKMLQIDSGCYKNVLRTKASKNFFQFFSKSFLKNEVEK